MNPFHLIDSILEDYAGPKVRRTIHAVLALALVLFTIWQAAGGDWKEAIAALAVALYAGANKANTPAVPEQPKPDAAEHAAWEAQPTHVDDIVPRSAGHDASDLYGDGDGAERGGLGWDGPLPEKDAVSGNQPPAIDEPEGPVNPPNRGWR